MGLVVRGARLRVATAMVVLGIGAVGCGTDATPTPTETPPPAVTPIVTATVAGPTATPASAAGPGAGAEVVGVAVSGEDGGYTFSVTVSSPDTGCDSYVDWWEVVTPAGGVVYRHTLLHSHVNEQPFTRFGGPVDVEAGDDVIVRAHMNTLGYGVAALRGSVASGFAPATLGVGFASDVESMDPQAPECAF